MKKLVPLSAFFIFLIACCYVITLPVKSFWRDPTFRADTLSRALVALERAWYDTKFRSKEVETVSQVIVAEIDDASIQRFGRWPWSRRVYAEILAELYQEGASVVAFDAVFSEPELNQDIVKQSFLRPIGNPAKSLAQTLKLKDTDLDFISKNLPEIGDAIFRDALSQFPNTVLGYIWLFGSNRECDIYDKNNPDDQKKYGTLTNLEAKTSGLLPLQDHEDALSGLYSQSYSHPKISAFDPNNRGNVILGNCVVGNRSALSAAARHSGAFNAIPDDDGILRRSQLLFGFNPLSLKNISEDNKIFIPQEWFSNATFFPGLALRAVMSHWQAKDFEVKMDESESGQRKITEILLKPPGADVVAIPTLPDSSLMTRFYGSQKTSRPIESFSLADVDRLSEQNFRGVVGAKALENKIVFIGPSALGVYDIRPTPVQQDMPGVFNHATTAARILDFAETGRAPGLVSAPATWHIGAFLFFALIILLLSVASHFWTGLMVSFVGLALLPVLDIFLFNRFRIVWHLPTFWLMLFLTIFLLALYRYFTEERQKSFVKSAFQKYVSPEVVQSILANPSSLNLGGKKQIVTLLFSDIKGFTTLAEKMEASNVSHFLNDYLSAMTDIVLANGGTIDKYIGDAIMAMFGAPVSFPDHADRAVITAKQMIKKLEELNAKWTAQNLPNISIRIGINSGEASVGNMGSKQIFSYTAVGDNVNLAARLESLNKQYGTQILVSAQTAQESKTAGDFKMVDRVKVMGKTKSVEVYTLLNLEWKDRFEIYEKALKLYFEQNFSQCLSLLADQVDFMPSANLSRRCELFLKEPPGPDWDGAWTIQEK